MQAEQVTDPIAFHGEGPVWHESWGGLRFVDMLAGDVVTPDLVGGVAHERLSLGDVAAAIRPRSAGGMVAATERSFVLVSPDGKVGYLKDAWADPAVRMNDGACDPDGRFYCGSMAYDLRPGVGCLYRLDVNHTVETVLENVTISNGLAWSRDGSEAFYVDSPTQRIDCFEYSYEEGLHNRRTAVLVDENSGMPDGLALDVDGGLWVALWGGAAVHHYSPSGKLIDIVSLPVTQVTACTFGGENYQELYITTSRQGLGDDEQLAAGSLFRIRADVPGLPPLMYGG